MSESRADNKSLASTLESVMQSHSQLQASMESLQLELGKKDVQLTQLADEKSVLSSYCLFSVCISGDTSCSVCLGLSSAN